MTQRARFRKRTWEGLNPEGTGVESELECTLSSSLLVLCVPFQSVCLINSLEFMRGILESSQHEQQPFLPPHELFFLGGDSTIQLGIEE